MYNLIHRLVTKWERFWFPDKPEFATPNEWQKWKEHQKQFMLKYIIGVYIPKKISSFIKLPYDLYNNFKFKFKIRFWKRHKYHLIDTKLKPEYYDIDTRMLHGLFSLLEDYVEIELAWKQVIFNDEKIGFWKGLNFRDEEAGRCYLEANENDKEILELYNWWKNRDKRELPPLDIEDDDAETVRTYFDVRDGHIKEDTLMMIRLVRIRERLW